MRLKNNLFLAKANLNGSRRKNSVMIMMILSVVAVISLIGFLNVVNSKMEANKQKDIIRQIYIMPEDSHIQTSDRGLTSENINEVFGIEHIISCEKIPYADNQMFATVKITDENGKDVSNTLNSINKDILTNNLNMQCVDNNNISSIIKGKTLEESPTMACIVPHYFLVGAEEKEYSTDELLGKTITVDYQYTIHLYNKSDVIGYDSEWANITDISYDLKVVGIYYYSRETAPTGATSILISPETAMKIENMALEKCQKEGGANVSDYINDPYARDYVVTVDDYDNVKEVQDKLNSLNFNAGIRAGYLDDATLAFSAVFSGAGTFLVVAVMLLTMINIFLSVHNNITDRKVEIGLMKALGYKNYQIFYCMYLENVILAIRALIIGGIISAIIVFVINQINSSGSIIQRIFVMPWSDFAVLFLLALIIILIIPFICQLIVINLIAKIQPQEAMNS